MPAAYSALVCASLLISPIAISSINPSLVTFAFLTPAPIATKAVNAATPRGRLSAFIVASSLQHPKYNIMSSSTAESDVPHVDPSTLKDLVEYAVSFSAANGLQVQVKTVPKENGDPSEKPASPNTATYTAAPISLLPNSYPSHLFQHATQKLCQPFNLLVDRISRDGDFLKKTLKDVRGVDEYTGKLLDLYEEIYLGERNGVKEDMEWGTFARSADRLGIFRSDYMLHKTGKDGDGGEGGGEYTLKQVELNTIASSFAGLASTVARLHSFLTERLEGELKEFLEENERAVGGGSSKNHEGRGVPVSPAMTCLPAAIALAHERYSQRFIKDPAESDVQPVVLFVVQPGETNTVDQRLLEFNLWQNHKVGVIRMSLAELYEKATLDENSGRLLLNLGNENNSKPQEITVVYFRAGYAPTDYPSGYNTKDETKPLGFEWLARERLERSRATKCPSLGYHLAGTKKVQQELARHGVVERFFPEDEGVPPLIRTAFAGLYSLGADANEGDLAAVKDVLIRGGEGRYVLKPQREGGGYNYYGEKLAQKLRDNCTITNTESGDEKGVKLSPTLSEFILMERLFPPQQQAILLRNGQVEGVGMTISEFGCFGTIVASSEGKVERNEYAGFLLRTKFSGVDEGGVASGFATLSSPYLC